MTATVRTATANIGQCDANGINYGYGHDRRPSSSSSSSSAFIVVVGSATEIFNWTTRVHEAARANSRSEFRTRQTAADSRRQTRAYAAADRDFRTRAFPFPGETDRLEPISPYTRTVHATAARTHRYTASGDTIAVVVLDGTYAENTCARPRVVVP